MPSAVAATASAPGHDNVVTAWSVPASAPGRGPGRAAHLLGRRAVVPGRAEPDGDEQRCGDRAPGRDPDDLVRAARRAREGEQRRQLAVERGVHGGRARGEPGRPLLAVVVGTGGQDADHERVRGGRRGSGPGAAQQVQLGTTPR